ncbi:hypothetical protein [Tunturiibacter gelidoferens]|uniref:Uncharacterized protein n=1 Tax=Tunturiibacter lichenicola TaxID=2051959 RepID=A0A7Y9NJE2_9BACT|nr:hypothetical protein [Edaphobacter lichenicola]NYF50419.1 hypothetical protein [Edaphobacter lichenicola]
MPLKQHLSTAGSLNHRRTCDIIQSMMFRSKSRPEDSQSEDIPVTAPLPFPRLAREDEGDAESTLIKTVGWISAGLGAVALGLFVGRELRQRYKFNRRTPYDFYAHSGDEQDVDFGLGI